MADMPAPDGKKDQPPAQLGMWMSIRLAWELGYLIALPAVVLGFGGAYLDRYVQTSPLFLLIGFALAALLSGVGVVRKVRAILKAS